ncbi:hypothetical protein IMSHALPRED_002971 [Imshaugia aleurites]|uniref:Uncharacterized protein n=1 Tax=Imshaugia aleurites TaxID=172621 RepID=A0A8H3ICV8_9LECA|nr:hypothetical protein IMSHALPRED_002971 [Imshaugia aleurites]
MKSNEDHGRGHNVSAHHWSSHAKQHAHRSDEYNRICMQLILQQNNATAPNVAAFNDGVSMQPPPSLNQGPGDQQAFQPQPTHPQHHHQHHVGSQHQQLHAHHVQPQTGAQPFHTGGHQPQFNYQQPQPGYQQSQYTFQQPQAGYQQPQQPFQPNGGPNQQQNYSLQQEQNLPGILFSLAKSCYKRL